MRLRNGGLVLLERGVRLPGTEEVTYTCSECHTHRDPHVRNMIRCRKVYGALMGMSVITIEVKESERMCYAVQKRQLRRSAQFSARSPLSSFAGLVGSNFKILSLPLPLSPFSMEARLKTATTKRMALK